jgi:hypothetical protein
MDFCYSVHQAYLFIYRPDRRLPLDVTGSSSPEESGGWEKFGEIFRISIFKTHSQAKTHRKL